MSKQLMIAFSASIGFGCCISTPADAQSLSAEEAQSLRDEIKLLKERLGALEKKLDGGIEKSTETRVPIAQAPAPEKKPDAPETAIDWKGSPQFVSTDRAFKVKGRIQADANYVAAPDSINDRGFGFSNEFRRLRLGGEGKLGSGIGYKLEFELSDNSVDVVDTFITYETKSWLFAVGNQNQFQSLDELIGDTTGSVMERAAFTDAFNFERRLGISAQRRMGAVLIQAGVFTDNIDALADDSDGPDGGDENNSFSVDGRLVYAPIVGDTQLHFGASGHLRTLNRLAETPVRYRQRPYVHSSNSRVLATPEMDIDRELHYGVEAAAVHGPWHMAAEGHWLTAERPDFPDATFFGGYAEVGYFLTRGDTRPYRNGIFGGTAPQRPLGKGGVGAIQLNLRYDYLDLIDQTIIGGKQNAYIAALVWTPINYLRLNLNYGYVEYDDAAILAGDRDDYSLHTLGTRIELDF